MAAKWGAVQSEECGGCPGDRLGDGVRETEMAASGASADEAGFFNRAASLTCHRAVRPVEDKKSVSVSHSCLSYGGRPPEAIRGRPDRSLIRESLESWYRYGDSNPGPVAENHVS